METDIFEANKIVRLPPPSPPSILHHPFNLNFCPLLESTLKSLVVVTSLLFHLNETRFSKSYFNSHKKV